MMHVRCPGPQVNTWSRIYTLCHRYVSITKLTAPELADCPKCQVAAGCAPHQLEAKP